MQPILIIDTASGGGHVALFTGSLPVTQRAFTSPRQQAEEIFPALAALLGEHGFTVGDLAAVAVATGPGAFTSLRVGLTAAKSLAEVAALPLIGISLMEAVARLAPGFPAAMLLPASRGEAFCCLATGCPATAPTHTPPLLSPINVAHAGAWLRGLPAAPRFVLSPSDALLASAAECTPPETHCVLIPGNWMDPLATLAGERHHARIFDDPLALDAAYVRHVDADKSWVDSRDAHQERPGGPAGSLDGPPGG